MSKWAVIACDQHSAEPEYWEAVETLVGDAPSSLHLMLPEAYLGQDRTDEINVTMKRYLDGGIFRTIENSYIYIERTLSNGKVRKGLIGSVNLDEYDFSRDSTSAIRATEGTVEERLPARIEIRKGAVLEMPHVMVFTQEDIFDTVKCHELLYDFDLNMGGGHLKGWRADADASVLHALAIGDGNHSLATAKLCGSSWALVELVDIRDPAIEFEPIHRVIFHSDVSEFEAPDFSECEGYAAIVNKAENYCRSYIAAHGGTIDYIHDDDRAMELGSRPGCAAVLLPRLDKTKLFDCINRDGPFPKKSFSIGHAADKRYYLECATIN